MLWQPSGFSQRGGVCDQQASPCCHYSPGRNDCQERGGKSAQTAPHHECRGRCPHRPETLRNHRSALNGMRPVVFVGDDAHIVPCRVGLYLRPVKWENVTLYYCIIPSHSPHQGNPLGFRDDVGIQSALEICTFTCYNVDKIMGMGYSIDNEGATGRRLAPRCHRSDRAGANGAVTSAFWPGRTGQ